MKLLAWFVLFAFPCASPALAAQDERPNLLFLLTDDQRNDSLGCAGHPVLQTPVIDSLAARGVRFENAFVTTPICAASRASIFTGTWERKHGYTFGTPPMTAEQIAMSYPTLLREAGYRTGFTGKFGVRAQPDSAKVLFDFFRSYGQPFQKKRKDGSVRHLTDIVGDDALEFLAEDDGRPFCLSISFNAPHAEDATKSNPYPHSPEEAELYKQGDIPQPRVDSEFWKGLPELFHDSLNRKRWFWRWDTPEKYDRFLRDYYRMISGIDRVTGQVLAELERMGKADNTVVIFTSDNGYYMGSRGFAGKWSHYEESLRVPLVVYDPRSPKEARGRVLSEMALNVDLGPTLLQLAGVEVPASAQGRSLLPLLRGQLSEPWREEFLFEHLLENKSIPRMEGVRGLDTVYARYIDDLPQGEFLHDLKRDPLQLENLAQGFEGASPRGAQLASYRRRCDELLAKASRETVRLLDFSRMPAGARILIGPDGHRMRPEGAGPGNWSFEQGELVAPTASDSMLTPDAYSDFRLHLEFNVNQAGNEQRERNGNSGLYLQQRYELQILDSHGVPAEDYQAWDCGSLYRLKRPDQPACRPAGTWQSYDVIFRAARFEGDRKIEDARITAFQNDVLIHDDFALPRKTGAGQAEGPEPRSIKLQGHGNPVRFRNFWVQTLGLESMPQVPANDPRRP